MKTDMRLITSQMNELEAVDSFNAIEKYISEEFKVSLSSLLTLNCIGYVSSALDYFI